MIFYDIGKVQGNSVQKMDNHGKTKLHLLHMVLGAQRALCNVQISRANVVEPTNQTTEGLTKYQPNRKTDSTQSDHPGTCIQDQDSREINQATFSQQN